jgi:hypothetical protein
MKLSVSNKGFTLANISGDELQIIQDVLAVVGNRCFRDGDFDQGLQKYCDGDNFLMSVTEEERTALRRFNADLGQEVGILLKKLKKQRGERVSVQG